MGKGFCCFSTIFSSLRKNTTSCLCYKIIFELNVTYHPDHYKRPCPQTSGHPSSSLYIVRKHTNMRLRLKPTPLPPDKTPLWFDLHTRVDLYVHGLCRTVRFTLKLVLDAELVSVNQLTQQICESADAANQWALGVSLRLVSTFWPKQEFIFPLNEIIGWNLWRNS